MKTGRIPILRLSLAIALAGPALAESPTATFLSASAHTVKVGDTVDVHFDAGAAKDARPAPWPSGQVAWMFIRGGPTQQNRHDVRPQRAEDNFVTVKVEHRGVTRVGLDRRPAQLRCAVSELRSFLTAHVTNGDKLAGQVRAANGHIGVRHVASSSTLIRAQDPAGASTPSAIATAKTGEAVEIRPLFDPTVAPPGSDVPLWVYVAGSKKQGLKVQATHVASGKTTTFETDAGGSGHFRLTDAGLWRVQVHHAEQRAGDPAAEWVIYSATLTFEAATKGADQ